MASEKRTKTESPATQPEQTQQESLPTPAKQDKTARSALAAKKKGRPFSQHGWQPPQLPIGVGFATDDTQEGFLERLAAVRLDFANEQRQPELVDSLLAECVAAAYQDHLAAHQVQLAKAFCLDDMSMVFKLRQSATTHLLRVIQTAKDLKRPPVNVTVRQADQVNLANQQQVNVNQCDKPRPDDLDTQETPSDDSSS